MNKPKNLWVFIHTWCLICRHRCRSQISRINGGFRGAGLQVAGYDVGLRSARGGIRTAPDTQHPQHPHRLMKDWSMSYIQIEETTKKKGATNDCVTGEREFLFFSFHYFTIHLTNTRTNVVDFCVQLRKQGVEGWDPIMFSIIKYPACQ